VGQKDNLNRSIIQSLDKGWELLRILPKEELRRVKPEDLEKFYK
jgi:V/A-type H+-transporting ATPase subunit B